MIFNRTQSDVDTAINLIQEKVKKFQPLTNEEIDILERGTMTINTLNRIEQKQEELKNLFNSMGYWNTNINNKTNWDLSDVFDGANFERIIHNLNVLREAFYTYKTTPSSPMASYHYESINNLEKILYDLNLMIYDIKSQYRMCNTFECGEE